MRFTKEQMRSELLGFLEDFARSVGRMYSHSVIGPMLGKSAEAGYNATADLDFARTTTLWQTLDSMFDYGVAGKRDTNRGRSDIGGDFGVDGAAADVELFLRGLDGLALYFKEDDFGLPDYCRLTVRMAVARNVLDGGTRYTDFGDTIFEGLSIGEVALLADMDERSVRNAANPKLQDPLKTETVGKRTAVPVEEARRWLAGRKGYVPTSNADLETVKTASLTLPADLAEALASKAKEVNQSVEEFLRANLFVEGESA